MESKEHRALLFEDAGSIHQYFGEGIYMQHERLDIAAAGQVANHSFNTMPDYDKIVGLVVSTDNSYSVSLTSEFGIKVNGNVIYPEGTPLAVLFTTPSSGSLLERISELIYADANGSHVEINYKDIGAASAYSLDFLFILKKGS